MSAIQTPLLFEPWIRPMVWGGRALATLGKRLPDEAVGESWEVSDHPSHRSVVVGGPFAGRTLRDLMESQRTALLGPAAARHATFPWLFKFLDAADWLSVQVHPDEEAVKRLWPGEGSKTEAWFIIHAEKGSRIYAGLRPGVGPGELRMALAAGTVADCLHSLTPRAGDSVFLPAGTVHALGGGVVLAEIQQTSDATFRLFDWNRRDAQGKSRKLHIEEAFAAIHWDAGPVTPIRAAGEQTSLVRCPYFHLDHRQTRQAFDIGPAGVLRALVVIRGTGRLGAQQLLPGQVWLLPADLPPARCVPDALLECLLCTLP
jgi:mannose-6-phosphate isomerase